MNEPEEESGTDTYSFSEIMKRGEEYKKRRTGNRRVGTRNH